MRDYGTYGKQTRAQAFTVLCYGTGRLKSYRTADFKKS